MRVDELLVAGAFHVGLAGVDGGHDGRGYVAGGAQFGLGHLPALVEVERHLAGLAQRLMEVVTQPAQFVLQQGDTAQLVGLERRLARAGTHPVEKAIHHKGRRCASSAAAVRRVLAAISSANQIPSPSSRQ